MIQLNQFLSLDLLQLFNRDYSNFKKDKENLQALLQMALEVELFTIPLYMSGMYSIEGYHQINTKKSDFYQGRQWPGAAPKYSANLTKDPKQDAFNKVFKVFIEEMLHLQIAANLCNAYGDEKKERVNAKFKGNGIVNEDYSWSCYGVNKTVIPGIIDFKDLKTGSDYKNTKVKLDALSKEHIKLFLAIESSEHDLQKEIDKGNKEKYEHNIPFEFSLNNEIQLQAYLAAKGSEHLLFGSISGLYISIIMYLLIRYDNNKRLYIEAFQNDSIQRDHFNNKSPEYPKLKTSLARETKKTISIEKLLKIIDGILDQGEGEPLYILIFNIIQRIFGQGKYLEKYYIDDLLSIKFDGKNALQKYYDETNNSIVKNNIKDIASKLNITLSSPEIKSVDLNNQTDDSALKENHKSYDDKGYPVDSASAAARGEANGKMDHHEIFEAVEKLILKGNVRTWDKVHQNKVDWKAEHLITNPEDYRENRKNYPQLPTAEEIAKAMNEVTRNKGTYKDLLSQASTGTLKGLLNGMEDYWAKDDRLFPYPAMSGSGDRMSICWALLGQTPDLSVAPDEKITKKNGFPEDHAKDYHACQGLYFPIEKESELSSIDPWVKNGEFGCASPAVYHSCKGSNTCKSESGCGYVQAYEGGANCGASAGGNNYSDPVYISAPGANNCATTGGCAVPISALQMFPAPYGEEQLMKYKNPDGAEETLNYKKGELVYDVAWKVYTKRYKSKFGRLPKKPDTNTLRLIFPPST